MLPLVRNKTAMKFAQYRMQHVYRPLSAGHELVRKLKTWVVDIETLLLVQKF